MSEISLTTFEELTQLNPCSTCNAPCCQVVMIPIKIPVCLMDLDHIRYLLNFPSLEVAVTRTGDWALLFHEQCSHFDSQSSLCKVHGTADQPLTCQYYNPHHCWYHANFSTADTHDIYVLGQKTFNHWVRLVSFNERGDVTSAPSFEESGQALTEIKESLRN